MVSTLGNYNRLQMTNLKRMDCIFCDVALLKRLGHYLSNINFVLLALLKSTVEPPVSDYPKFNP